MTPADPSPALGPPPPVVYVDPAHLARLLAGRAVRVGPVWICPSRRLALLCQADPLDDLSTPAVVAVALRKRV